MLPVLILLRIWYRHRIAVFADVRPEVDDATLALRCRLHPVSGQKRLENNEVGPLSLHEDEDVIVVVEDVLVDAARA